MESTQRGVYTERVLRMQYTHETYSERGIRTESASERGICTESTSEMGIGMESTSERSLHMESTQNGVYA